MATNDTMRELPSEVKASVLESGALAKLKTVSHDSANREQDQIDTLKQQAHNALDNIRQLLNSGKLDDSAAQRLTAALTKLNSVLAGDGISRSSLIMALSEATSAIATVDANGAMLTLEQKTELLWHQIEKANLDIDDDFEKMRRAGVTFNEKLWNKHKELMEYLQKHPHDIQKQKELNAIDEVMMMQAETQIKDCPDAQSPYEDAKKKSDERRQAVDKIETLFAKETSITGADFENDAHAFKKDSESNLTIDDIALTTLSPKVKPTGTQLG